MRIYITQSDYDLLLINESGLGLLPIFKQAIAAKANHLDFKLKIDCSALIGKQFSATRVQIDESSIPEPISSLLERFPDAKSKGEFLKAIVRGCIDYDWLLGLSGPQPVVAYSPVQVVKPVEIRQERKTIEQKTTVCNSAPKKAEKRIAVKQDEPMIPEIQEEPEAFVQTEEPSHVEDSRSILKWNGITVDINDLSGNPLRSLEGKIDYSKSAHANVTAYCVYFYMRMNDYLTDYEENRKTGKETSLEELWGRSPEQYTLGDVIQRRIDVTRQKREQAAQKPQQKSPMKISEIRSNLMRSGGSVMR